MRLRSCLQMPDQATFPVGAAVTLGELDRDPHPVLAQLREVEPASWLPALDGWLLTRHDLALRAMRDFETFTVDDPRFSTAQVIGPSMLSLDGNEHARHRAAFAAPFRPAQVRRRFADATELAVNALIDRLGPSGGTELRRAFAGPLATSIVARVLGLGETEVETVLAWYDAIVASVTSITAGKGRTVEGEEAFAALSERLQEVIEGGDSASLLAAAAADSDLAAERIISNAAVLLFGGIETTEGMIANAVLALLERPDQLDLVRHEPGLVDLALEESLRLEPAAAVIDRYATADVQLAGAQIAAGELVRISITAVNRDPAVFRDPDSFDLARGGARGHIAFAHGPHVCVGIHLARLEACVALATLVTRLPRLRLDSERPAAVRGLVFRKPPELRVLWD